MRHAFTERIKQSLRPALYRALYRRREQFDCPICGYHGPFKDKRVSHDPDVVRADSKCPGCGAAERHRMLRLVIRDVLQPHGSPQKSLLHIAPELCLRDWLSALYGTYHTADLFQPGVDFREDLQALSFPDASYDCVVVSRVLTIPPDLNACIREIRRVLKPGGIALIAEIYSHENTVEFGRMIESRSREIGMDLLDLYAQHFPRVETVLSSRYDGRFQLANRILRNGVPADKFPAEIRIPETGFMELVAACHVE